MRTTLLSIRDSLPLTCTRSGTCCHGNLVRLNPWELARLSSAKGMSPAAFRESYTIGGGSILHFDGKTDQKGKKSCGLYEEGTGCSVHPARPLACRLFPLGRQIQNGTANYIFQGSTFPCLNECPEVTDLPSLTVEEYLVGQQTAPFEQAQDEYMEVMQNIADVALSLLLDTGLKESGTETLAEWRRLGLLAPDSLASKIGIEWLDLLALPGLEQVVEEPLRFVQHHDELIQVKMQELVNTLSSFEAVKEAAVLLMSMALFLGYSLGADASGLSEHWIAIAKENGAAE